MDNRNELISLLVSTEEKKFLMSIADKVHLSLTDFVLLSVISTNGKVFVDKFPPVESNER